MLIKIVNKNKVFQFLVLLLLLISTFFTIYLENIRRPASNRR